MRTLSAGDNTHSDILLLTAVLRLQYSGLDVRHIHPRVLNLSFVIHLPILKLF